jgi:hypothetical protein
MADLSTFTAAYMILDEDMLSDNEDNDDFIEIMGMQAISYVSLYQKY